jgi:hypothetical protein
METVNIAFGSFLFLTVLGLVGKRHEEFFPQIKNFAECEKSLNTYAQLFGDCEIPRQFNFSWGKWILVGHGKISKISCGKFKSFKICSRTELHGQSKLNGENHAGEVFVHKVHQWCHSPLCPTCFLYGWAKREADHATQRLEKASKGYVDEKGVKHAPLGNPQHIVVSPPETDWGLAEFQNSKFIEKVKRLINEVGIEGGCIIFHGFRCASWEESIGKHVQYGWRWSPHAHIVGFILGGYSKCRYCTPSPKCLSCDGFEGRVRKSYQTNKYIINAWMRGLLFLAPFGTSFRI